MELELVELQFLKVKSSLTSSILFLTEIVLHCEVQASLSLNLNPPKPTGPSLFFVIETSTHPNPHSKEYKSKLLLRHWNFNPPKPTLQAPAKRTRKHHAGVYEPPCHSKHNTAKACRFRLRFRVNIWAAITTLIRWVCWFRYGSLRVCLDFLEKKSFDCWRRRVVLAERVLKLRL